MDVPTIPARSIVIKNKSTAWFGTRYTMNIYRGCSHGCIYCDSRSECYGVQDFDTVRVKSDALAVIRNDLRSKTQSGVVATGSMSDPYNPFEKELQLTRHALELLDAYGFGAAVATKGTLITRDADILREIASHSPVLCKITVTTCDDALAAKLEPRAPSSSARLAAVEKLAGQGIFTGVLLMPVLPFLEDTPDGVRSWCGRRTTQGALCISGLRCDAAPEPGGLFSGQAGRAVPRRRAAGAACAAVRHTV